MPEQTKLTMTPQEFHECFALGLALKYNKQYRGNLFIKKKSIKRYTNDHTSEIVETIESITFNAEDLCVSEQS